MTNDISTLHPLILAYIGDSVYDLFVRTKAIEKREKLDKINTRVTSTVRATAQAKALDIVRPLLTEDESEIVRRARNSHSKHSHPKSASCIEYKSATAFEALIGYLHLKGESARLAALFNIVIDQFWSETCQEQN